MSTDRSSNKNLVTIAVIAVRGTAKTPQPVKDTLAMLNLHRKNFCVLYPQTPSLRGMLAAVKDYITWGEISEEVLNELLEKRGAMYNGRTTDRTKCYSYHLLQHHGKTYKPYFRLNPPRKGFGRKGIKVSFSAGGALGYRGDKVNDLLRRMI